MDLATATNITSSNGNNDLSENQFFEKQESVMETMIKPLTFTNGVLKRHGSNPVGKFPTATATALTVINATAEAIATSQQIVVVANNSNNIYQECLKNHAASLGGHALDGCGEFMQSPNSSPANPISLRCAACGCHRNFHRRDPDDPYPLVIQPPTPTTTQVIEYQPLNRLQPPAPVTSPSPPSPPPISSSYYPSSAPQMLLALSSGGAQNPPRATGTVQIPAENSQNASVFAKAAPVSNSNGMQLTTTPAITPNGRKRFRTKFSSEQKEKMQDFAERVGWKMQRRDHEMVASFCNKIGVDRGVLKVWMHNNKIKSGDNHHQINNQQQQHQTHVLNNVVNGTNIVRTNNIVHHAVDINALNINHSAMHNSNLIKNLNNYHHHDDEDYSEDDDTSPHLGGNGSSSSS